MDALDAPNTSKDPDPNAPQDEHALADLLDRRLRAADAERWEWSVEMLRARQYYESHQWGDLTGEDADTVMPVTANVIRRDVDQTVAAVIDAEPVVNPKGRYAKSYAVGRRLLDVVKWSRDEEENHFNDLEDCITDCVHTGEGALSEYFDMNAADGKGMPRSRWVENVFLVWDPAAREFQRDDADWIIEYRPRKVEYLERKYAKQLKGRTLNADVPDLLLGHQTGRDTAGAGYDERYLDYRRRLGFEFDMGSEDWRTLEPQAYEKIMWEKKIAFETHYTDKETGKKVLVDDPEAEDGRRPLSEEEYKALPPEARKGLDEVTVEVPQLWKTVAVNNYILEHDLSIYDRSKGGHGHYPYAFFTYVRLRTRSHGKGEIEFLVGLQDLINRTLARWLEQMVIAGSQFVHSQMGSMPPEDVEKAENIGRKTLQHIRTYPGFQAPQVVSANPTGANLFSNGYTFVQAIKDQVSGVREVNRGDMPYQTSGKGIRALQAQADLLGTVPRKHIESGLRRATVLRLSNILQFMRGNRVAEAVDQHTGEAQALYIGESMGELLATYPDELTVLTDKRTGQAMIDPQTGEPLALADKVTGEEVQTLILNDDEAERISMTQIEYELDTGRERNRQERMEVAREALQVGGPALMEWYLEMLDVPNKELAVEALKKQGLVDQLAQALDDAAKQHGIPTEQLVQIVLSDIQSSLQPQGPPPAGPGAPPGAPPAAPAPPPNPGTPAPTPEGVLVS